MNRRPMTTNKLTNALISELTKTDDTENAAYSFSKEEVYPESALTKARKEVIDFLKITLQFKNIKLSGSFKVFSVT